MEELINYLNQSGITDIIRVYAVVIPIIFIAVFTLTIWLFIKISRTMFKNREDAISDFHCKRAKQKDNL